MLNRWSGCITHAWRKHRGAYYIYEMHTLTTFYVRVINDVWTFHVPYLSSLSPFSGAVDASWEEAKRKQKGFCRLLENDKRHVCCSNMLQIDIVNGEKFIRSKGFVQFTGAKPALGPNCLWYHSPCGAVHTFLRRWNHNVRMRVERMKHVHNEYTTDA